MKRYYLLVYINDTELMYLSPMRGRKTKEEALEDKKHYRKPNAKFKIEVHTIESYEVA